MSDDLRTLIDRATPAPADTPDFASLAARSSRRRALGTAATAVVAVVALVAGAVVLWPSPGRMPVIDQAPTTPAGDLPPPLPAGWQEVTVGGASFGVPGDWTVETYGPDEPFCTNGGDMPTVYVAPEGTTDAVCKLRGHASDSVTAQPLSQLTRDLPDLDLNVTTPTGVRGAELVAGGDNIIRFWSQEVDIHLDIAGPQSVRGLTDQILATLVPAGTQRRAPVAAPALPDGWQEVTVGGASFGVPGDWAVETYEPDEPFCPNGAASPTVYVTPPSDADTPCPAVGPSSVSITAHPLSQLAGDLPRPERNVTTSAGVTGAEFVTNPEENAIRFWSEQVDVHLDIAGPDSVRRLTDQILATLVPAGTERQRLVSASALPEGWQEVVVAGASLGVPADWELRLRAPAGPFLCQAGSGPSIAQVVDPSHPESAPEGSVYSCPAVPRPAGLGLIGGPISDPSSERALTVDGRARPLDATTVNGMDAFQASFVDEYDENVTLITIPELDVWLYATDVDQDPETFDRIVETIAPAGNPRPDAAVAAEWEPADDYVYEFASGCGERLLLGRFAVTVEDGRVADQVALDSVGQAVLNGGDYGTLPTLAGLLDQADAAIADGADRVDIERADDGRPTYIDIDYRADAIDDEACYDIVRYEPENPALGSGRGVAMFADLISATWTRADGTSAPSEVVNVIQGPEHCGWDSSLWLHLGWPLGTAAESAEQIRQYVRDPEDVLGMADEFDRQASLPEGSTFTGFTTDDVELWLGPDNGDAAIYLVFAPEVVQHWPRSAEVIACS